MAILPKSVRSVPVSPGSGVTVNGGEAPVPDLLGMEPIPQKQEATEPISPSPQPQLQPPAVEPPKSKILPNPSLQLAQTLAIYGETNTRKTTEFGKLIELLWETYHLPSRLITVEPNYDHIKPLVEAGILEVFPITPDFKSPLSLLRALCEGSWLPIRAINGKPVLTPAVKREVQLPTGERILRLELQRPIGGYFFEGISTASNLLLRYVTNTGRKIGEDVVGSFTEDSYVEGERDESYAASGRSHYGFIQNQMVDLVTALCSLPVKMVGFSSHEGKGKDPFSGTIYGMKLVGTAATNVLPPLLGDLFHCETITFPPDQQGKRKRPSVYAYFEKHPDSENSAILWPAKPRWPSKRIETLWDRWQGGFIDLNSESIADYFRLRWKVEAEEGERLRQWKEQSQAPTQS